MPLDQTHRIGADERIDQLWVPAQADLTLTVGALLVSGGRPSSLLTIPFKIEEAETLDLDLANPPGGVIEGKIDSEDSSYFLIRTRAGSQGNQGMTRTCFIGPSGQFRLSGLHQNDLRLMVLDKHFNAIPLDQYRIELTKGVTLPDNYFSPEY